MTGIQPQHLLVHAEHGWVRALADGQAAAFVGITAFAAEQLGEIVFVDVPGVGTDITQGEPYGQVESAKSIADLIAPVSGTVVRVNEALERGPETINDDPYGEGWIIEARLGDPGQLSSLLDASSYESEIGD